MSNATFLLAINFSIGVSFAGAFWVLFRKSRIALGYWCSLGFLSAAATTVVEASAPFIPSVHLISALSVGSLLAALTAIAIGLARHVQAPRVIPYVLAWSGGCFLVNVLVVFYLRRGTWEQSFGYQTPFSVILIASCALVLIKGKRGRADFLLASVLAMSGVQFASKAILQWQSGQEASVRHYIFSQYAFYSQTAGGILSIFLGLSLLGVIFVDMIDQAKKEFDLDALSGVLTRGAFLKYAEVWLKQTPDSTVVVCDLDHFKSINDGFGHASGDEVIRRFGDILTDRFDNRALCGRIGGEEFCILMPGSEPWTIEEAIDQIRLTLTGLEFSSLPRSRKVTASFGLAARRSDEPLANALHRADAALYRAKASGRDCYCWSLEMDDTVRAMS